MSEPNFVKRMPVAAFVKTTNLHAATWLGTVGCKPFRKKFPEFTKDGKLISPAYWTYESNAMTDEALGLWQEPGVCQQQDKPVPPSKDWEQLTREEKRMVTKFVMIFAANLKHFLKDCHV